MSFSDRFLYWSAWILCRVIFTLYNRMAVMGLKRALKNDGPVIIAANHCSNLDPIIIGCAYPRRLRYLAKSSLFKIPLLGTLIKWLGAIPAKREDVQGAASALKQLISILEAGESVLVFPEGSRSSDGKLQPLEEGVAMLSAKTGAVIIPVRVDGTFKALPKYAKVFKPYKIIVDFGEAIDPKNFKEKSSSSKELRRLITEEVAKRLSALREEVENH